MERAFRIYELVSDDVGFKKVWNKVGQGGLNSEENYNHYQ